MDRCHITPGRRWAPGEWRRFAMRLRAILSILAHQRRPDLNTGLDTMVAHRHLMARLPAEVAP